MGLTVNDENRQKAQWLVSADLALTTDTLQQLAELDGISYPVTEDTFAQAAAAAIAEGKSPMYDVIIMALRPRLFCMKETW